MKLVIEIPEEIYEELKSHYKNITGGLVTHEAIANGTPLPKAHGRLIDADALLEQFRDGTEGYDCAAYTRHEIGNIIDLEDTIIEADKEEE